MFSIELFWGSIFEGEGVSHPESKVWGKFRNKSYAFFEFMKPSFALFWPYCSGQAKSGCGGVLAVDIGDFRRQRSAWFNETKSIIMPNSLILMSSTSFGEYLNAGTTCMKFGQNGRKPRPAGLFTLAIQAHLWSECSWVQIQANPMWFYTKCINHDRKAWAMTSWSTGSDQT